MLGIRELDVAEAVELRELSPAASPGGLGDRGVFVVREELERLLFAVFLAHEEKRRERREEDARRRDAELRGVEPVAQGPVSDLVVVLRADDEALPFGLLEGARELLDRAVLLVVAVPLTGEKDVERMVEGIPPLGVVIPLLEGPAILGVCLGHDQGTRVLPAHPLR